MVTYLSVTGILPGEAALEVEDGLLKQEGLPHHHHHHMSSGDPFLWPPLSQTRCSMVLHHQPRVAVSKWALLTHGWGGSCRYPQPEC